MNESEQAPKESTRSRQPRLTSDKALPKSGAETLVKIIKGYAIASNGGEQQVNYKDVASVAGLSPNVVSGNNSFLLESELLSSPKYGFYVPSESAIRFAREAAWDEPSAKAHLRKHIASSWYGQVGVQNFALRPSLSKDDLKRALAIKSGATEGESAFLDSLVEFLIYTGLVVEDDKGNLTRGDFESVVQPPGPSAPSSDKQEKQQISPKEPTAEVSKVAGNRHISLVVHVHINRLDDLTEQRARQLKHWFEALHTQPGVELHIESDQPVSSTGGQLAPSSEQK